jgi:two-component system, OmpR family, response regulator
VPHFPLRVAHVDDDDDLLAVVRLALEATAGMQVESCASGARALEVIPDFHPDVILVDLLMPGMGGLETIERLRERMDLSQVTVAFATGHEDPEQLRRIVEAGAAAIIHKPFDAFALADRIHRIAPR